MPVIWYQNMKQYLVFGFLGFFMVAGTVLFVPISSDADSLPELKCSYPCGTSDSPTNVQAPVSLGVGQNDAFKEYDFVVKKLDDTLVENSLWISSSSYVTTKIKDKGIYKWHAAAKSTDGKEEKSTTESYFNVTKVCPEGSICIQNPLQTTSFTGVVDKILDILFFVAIAVAPVMIIVAGFKFLTGGGDPKNLTTARQMLIWTGVGFGIILLSKGIVMILKSVIGF